MIARKGRFKQLSEEILIAVLRAYKEQRDAIPDSDLDNEQPISLNVRLTLGQGRELNIFEGVAFDRPFPNQLYLPRTNSANVGDPSERDVQKMVRANREYIQRETDADKYLAGMLAKAEGYNADNIMQQPVQLSAPKPCSNCERFGYKSCAPWCPNRPNRPPA